MNTQRSAAPNGLARSFVDKLAAVRSEYAELLDILAELTAHDVHAELGYGTVEKLVADLGNLGVADSRRVSGRSAALHGALPATAQALRDGAVSGAHVDRIAEFHDSLPTDLDTSTWEAAERELADLARTVPPRGLTRRINHLRANLAPHTPTEAELAQPHRELRTTWRGDELHFTGVLDKEAGLLLEAALEPLAAPHPAVNGVPDERTGAQRYGDAFTDLITTSTDAQPGGTPITLLLTMNEQDLRDGIGHATTMDADTIPVSQLRRIACDAGIIPTVLGKTGETVDTGNRARTAPASVRNRLILRDHGCAFPGCGAPPARTHAHHIQHWADGGATTMANLVLLCPAHHRTLHHTQWTVHIGHNGLPEFHPPPYLAPMVTRSSLSSPSLEVVT